MIRPSIMSYLVAGLARSVSPGYGTCSRCRMPWRFATPHVVDLRGNVDSFSGGSSGCFALCDPCWQIASPLERLHHHHQLWLTSDRAPEWLTIAAAILALPPEGAERWLDSAAPELQVAAAASLKDRQ